MDSSALQKTATSNELPIEILNPLQAAKHYRLHLYSPSNKLTPFVDRYWVLRWNLPDKHSFTCEVIPSPYINLTFMQEGARITGVTTGRYMYEVKGAGVIVGAQFKPGGFYPFWQQNLSELTDKAVPASSVFQEIDTSFNGAMLSLDDKRAVARLEALLLTYKPPADKNIELIGTIIASLRSGDHQSVRSVAQAFGMSDRSLQELFHRYVGVGLKWVILRARLQKAAKWAAELESPNWTSIAAELGYADQSHFVNDFKRIIGVSPGKYADRTRAAK